MLWVSVPLEVRIEKAGSRKVYVSAQKVKWALEAPQKRREVIPPLSLSGQENERFAGSPLTTA